MDSEGLDISYHSINQLRGVSDSRSFHLFIADLPALYFTYHVIAVESYLFSSHIRPRSCVSHLIFYKQLIAVC